MASCPLGFESAGANKGELSQYHCVLCRALLHKPVRVDSCRHVFCAFCIGRFRDCPVCGLDINSTSPDDDLSDAIGKIVIGHVRLACRSSRASCSVASGQASTSSTAACPVASTSRTHPLKAAADEAALDLPSLLLQLSLQSLSGGNPEAALTRLDMCADALCSLAGISIAVEPPQVTGPASPQSAPTDPAISTSGPLPHHLAASATDPNTASRLGAVLGCQADCHRRLGDPAAAQRCYLASLACMAPWRGRNREVDSARSVTHNKLGDLLMMGGDLGPAREHYESAMGIRREVLGGEVGKKGGGGGSEGEEMVQDVCDLATSLCKVADVWMTLREEGAQGGDLKRPEDGNGDVEEVQSRGQSGGKPEVLLAEARQVMLEDALLPYARACGVAAEAGAGVEPDVVAAGEKDSGGAVEAPAEVGAEKGNEKDVKGTETEGAKLAPGLVQRYGRVWGAIEQLTARLKEMQVV